MYFITNPTTILYEKYYKEDKKHLLVPTKIPHLFESYDQARNAIERTTTFCRKLRKLNLYGGLDQNNNPAVEPLPYRSFAHIARGQYKRDQIYRYRMHQIAKKGGFYGFSPKSLSIVRVAMPKVARYSSIGFTVETEAEAIERGMLDLKLSMLNSWVDNDLDRKLLTHFMNKLTPTAADKATLDRMYERLQMAPFDLSGKNIVKTDNSDGFDNAKPTPDPYLQVSCKPKKVRWYNRFFKYMHERWGFDGNPFY